MNENLSQNPSGAENGNHPVRNPNPAPYREAPPKPIAVPPEAQKAVNLGTGQHFEEIQAREKIQKDHQKSAQ